MGRDRFLRTVGGRYDFRRRVPSDLVGIVCRREMIRSLGSVPHHIAKARARELAVWSDGMFRAVRDMKKLDARRAAELARDFFRDGLDRYEAERLNDGPQLHELSRSSIRDDNWGPAAKAADALLRREGIAAEKESDAYVSLCRGLIRASAEIGRISAARRDGDYTARPLDPLFAVDRDALQASASPKFAEAWARYVAEKVKVGAWREDMRRENATTSALFMEAVGDNRLDRYRRTQFSDFAATLQALPALRGKVPQFSGKAISELVAMTEADPAIRTLSPKSVGKHVSNLSSFFGWAIDQGYLETNPVKGVFKLRRVVRRNEERSAWSSDQLHALFTSPLYQGSVSAHYRMRPGPVLVRDARYWVPLLLAFHPMRLEEVCQLRLADVMEDEGIAFFNVHAAVDDDPEGAKAPARKLKTRAARRRVPIHPLLREVGFLTYVEGMRRPGEILVFPELKPGGTAKRLGYNISKWFPSYRTALGIMGVDLHGLRHTAITALVRAGVHPDVVDALDGHETPGERGRYAKAPELPVLYDAVAKIAYSGVQAEIFRAHELNVDPVKEDLGVQDVVQR